MTKAVTCIDVEKSYTRGREVVPVLTGINLEIDEGDFLALMGPSGSGKSSVVRVNRGVPLFMPSS